MLPPPLTSTQLRHQLNTLAHSRAVRMAQTHQITLSPTPSVLFGVNGDDTHGNFHPSAYQAIAANQAWQRRLRKSHPLAPHHRAHANWPWRELDCATSSDALLMNIFCAPEAYTPRLTLLLGVPAQARPHFGIRAHLPLTTHLTDTTEIDMQLDQTIFEAKLTETGFQQARPELVHRLRDIEAVFDLHLLPRTSPRSTRVHAWDHSEERLIPVTRGQPGHYLHYQLIRNILAAHTHQLRFCLLADARRADLIEAFARIQAAVRAESLRTRLQMLTWQELAGALPLNLQLFLADKYGIEPTA